MVNYYKVSRFIERGDLKEIFKKYLKQNKNFHYVGRLYNDEGEYCGFVLEKRIGNLVEQIEVEVRPKF
ncbi:MAG: hypothetical protein ACTSR2_01335 [Candidatus Hodarchaeales archaeon]